MAGKEDIKYSISLSLKEIQLPPVEDILILGKNTRQGPIGIKKCFNLLVPNNFQMFEIEDDNVEAIFVSKKTLKKMPVDRIIKVLSSKVFPFISEKEIASVRFKVLISYDTIEIQNDES